MTDYIKKPEQFWDGILWINDTVIKVKKKNVKKAGNSF